MNIEFHITQGEVHEWIVDHVKEKLMELYHKDKEISRAEVYFKENGHEPEGNKVCEIELTIYGDSIFVHRNAITYQQAAKEVLMELSQKVDELVKKLKEPPDKIVSTVKV